MGLIEKIASRTDFEMVRRGRCLAFLRAGARCHSLVMRLHVAPVILWID